MSSPLRKPVTYMNMAAELATLSTCRRRTVGCILVDEYWRVLATGYNGVPAGARHCTDVACSGASSKPGEGLDKCEAIHAEQNALMHCADVMKVHAVVVTCTPCVHCAKMLLNTSARILLYGSKYADEAGLRLWETSGRAAKYVFTARLATPGF